MARKPRTKPKAAPRTRSERAERVIAFVESLRIPDGKDFGKPFRLRPWQRDFIYRVYAPAHLSGLRVVRNAILTVARKNGKTALIAALVLCHLIGPEATMNAQIYSAAFERGQAALVYRAASAMVRQDDELHNLLSLTDSSKTITYPATGSTYTALSAESRSKHGMNPTLIIMDELAQFGANRELYDVLTTSTGAQAEPLCIVISTQAANDEAVLSQLIDYGRQVNSGEFTDPTFVLVEYSTPEDADVWQEEAWYLANPGLGDFRSLDEIREYAARAKRNPALERTFRNLYLNQRVAGESAFIAPSTWKANGGALREDLAGRVCFGGLDLSAKLDLTALVLVFPDDDGGYDVLPFFWTPKATLDERTKRDRVPYYEWAQRGLVEATPGHTVDYNVVVQKLVSLSATYDIRAIAYDRWRIDVLKLLLDNAGVSEHDLTLMPFGQGFKDMSPAVDNVEELLLADKLRHGNQPVLTWNASNAVVICDPANNRKIDKSRSFGRIDGFVAMTMALAVAQTTVDTTSVYRSRGMVFI